MCVHGSGADGESKRTSKGGTCTYVLFDTDALLKTFETHELQILPLQSLVLLLADATHMFVDGRTYHGCHYQ